MVSVGHFMRLLHFAALSCLASVTLHDAAQADPAKARLIAKGQTAFECSIFAAFMTGEGEAESQRFFQLGYDSSMKFMTALAAGEVTEEEFRAYVHLDVALNLKRVGETDPAFAIGRLYQSTRSFAGDRAMYGRTPSGAIDYEKKLDTGQSAAMARKLYDQARCALLD